ncbi:MATE family efflux transporter, partial [Porphyromonas loveana]|uniref:MATE family efflux transporter n=2 Tax=Porphyromonas loveana TaxID=1884669 RepID=UPI0035A06932
MSSQQIQALESKKIPKLLFSYALPAVVGTVLNSIYNIVDRIFIGHGVSEYALSGLAITFPILIFMQAFGMLVGAGASVRVSIQLGQKNIRGAEHTLANAIFLTLFTQFITIVPCFLFMEPLLRLFGASDRTLPYAMEYLQIVIPANIFSTLSFGYNSVMRASGYPRKAMTTMIIGALTNVVLDYVFIYPLDMGIRGAAIATAISMMVCSFYVLAHFFRRDSIVRFRRSAFKLSLPAIGGITAIGVAPFAMQLTGSLVNVIMNRSFVAYGDTPETTDLAIGAFGIINSYAMLFFMII